MTLREALHAYLRDEVDVSVHESRLPTRPIMPALVVRFVSAYMVHTHSNRRSLLPRRVQVNAYANNDTEVDAIATRLLYALDHFHGILPGTGVAIGWARLLTDLDSEPIEQKGAPVMYRRILDFEIAYQEVPTES